MIGFVGEASSISKRFFSLLSQTSLEKESEGIFHDSQVVAANVGIARKEYHHRCFNVGGKEDCAMINENVVPLWYALPITLTARLAISHQEWELARKGHQNVAKKAVNAVMNKNVVGV